MGRLYGDRAECRIRPEVVAITYLDVRSMYPTVFSLLGLQRLLIAEQIGCEDVSQQVRELVDQITLWKLFEERIWLDLCAICEVEPDGEDVLPSRAKYGGSASRSIGLNYVKSDRPLWC
jgi:hypothetical protein